tara:strand:- start:4724 stop:5140 length:417 start_codon:yes stop_codon:yes gene_type:complete
MRGKLSQGWVLLAFLLYCIFLICLSGLKSAGLFLPHIYDLEQWMGGDKWMHLKFSAILSILACFASERVLDLAAFRRMLVVLLSLMLALAIDESLQYLLVSRRFEFLDYAYGLSGVVSGISLYALILAARSAGNHKRA